MLSNFLRCCRLIFLAWAFMQLSACTNLQHTPVPEQLINVAEVPNFAGVRSWADDFSPGFAMAMSEREKQIRSSGLANRPINVLALSGGGGDGAFGAGVLNGWSANKRRPEFEVVTGVSTGALIAPLAFLGRGYDETLKDFYTNTKTSNVLVANPIGGIFGGSALASNSPLQKMIAEIVDSEFLRKIAAQHARGRRLFVVTTNLEAQRPVLWDMGKIAIQDTPQALELFRSLLLASSAIPGAFPPVALKVEADGKIYTELQVDGGTTANSFVAPLNASLPRETANRRKSIFVVQSGKLVPDYQTVNPQTLKLAGRAIKTLLKYKNFADIRRLYLLARQTGANFRMISVPESFDRTSKEPFDKAYMNELYELGYKMGRHGSAWVTRPNVF
jgi:predicted acylesterase/phospholipase RssA